MSQMTVSVSTQGFLVDGKWIEQGELQEIRAPFDGSVIAQVYQGTREHAQAAITAAVKAFGTTRRLPAFERQRVLRRVAQSIAERKEEFARTMAQEAGKPIKASRTEVERAIFTFNVAAEESTRIYGEYIPLDWSDRGNHAVQFSFEPGRPQGGSRNRQWLQHDLEARSTNSIKRVSASRVRATSRMARRRPQRPPTLQ